MKTRLFGIMEIGDGRVIFFNPNFPENLKNGEKVSSYVELVNLIGSSIGVSIKDYSGDVYPVLTYLEAFGGYKRLKPENRIYVADFEGYMKGCQRYVSPESIPLAILRMQI